MDLLIRLGIAKLSEDVQHFIACQIAAMILDFVFVDRQCQFAAVIRQPRVRASKLPPFLPA